MPRPPSRFRNTRSKMTINSFLNVFKTVAQVAAPIASTFLPQFAPLITLAQNAIVNAEANSPGPSTGPIKLAAVVSDFQSGIALTQQVLAVNGMKLTWEENLLREATSAQVEAYNKFSDFQASIKLEKL